ncbi:hypothetical protein [Streptomyces sp. IMTB 1903]|uniref:hypothetical protein n=1 Tax=Streptomyces sp. IMTB 1903 TaxID=1776680 RepID=UPI000757CC0F|nr:hypothetical protein [Streptomyces sp. IMTB 1903]
MRYRTATAATGGHTITVRTTDGTGQVQTEQRARTIPDGASGWHSVLQLRSDSGHLRSFVVIF